MKTEVTTPLKIGIIGAGFSGVALAAHLSRLSLIPLDIFLFEKRGYFGVGEAYSTPYPFHLLNVRAHDMSVFADDAEHFVNWLQQQKHLTANLDQTVPLGDQFVPRLFYGKYLRDLLQDMQVQRNKINLTLLPHEVVNVQKQAQKTDLILSGHSKMTIDKVIFALGNIKSPLPFPVHSNAKTILNAWDFTAPQHIPTHDPVLIVGTGLSMIDAVLTLYHQQHQGEIYAVSRHGCLPLAHAEEQRDALFFEETLPTTLRLLTKQLRLKNKNHQAQGGDWRTLINAVRKQFPHLWLNANLFDKKQFIRHVLPYWNSHRHRVPQKIAFLLAQMRREKRLHIFAGRILAVEKDHAKIKLRHQQTPLLLPSKWLINCLGPALNIHAVPDLLIQSLFKQGLATSDHLELGLLTSAQGALKNPHGDISKDWFTLGPLTKGMWWEISAVPEIRQACFTLAKHLLT